MGNYEEGVYEAVTQSTSNQISATFFVWLALVLVAMMIFVSAAQ